MGEAPRGLGLRMGPTFSQKNWKNGVRFYAEIRVSRRDTQRRAEVHSGTRHKRRPLLVFCLVDFDCAIGQGEQEQIYGFANFDAALDIGFIEKPLLYQGIEPIAVNFEGDDDSPAVAPFSVTTHADGGR